MNKLIQTTIVLTLLIFTNASIAQEMLSAVGSQTVKTDYTAMNAQARVSGGVAFLLLFGTAYGTRKLLITFQLDKHH